MRLEPEAAASLCAVLRKDAALISEMSAQLTPLLPDIAADEPVFRDLAAAAYILHNIYSALENSFEQISRTFENHVVDLARWHRELLDKMFLEIPGLRPALLPEALRAPLNDLRGFRHVFRHSYDFQIDPVRLRRVANRWQEIETQTLESLNAFAGDLIGENAGS